MNLRDRAIREQADQTAAMNKQISFGDRVTIIKRFGQRFTGRAVMKGPYGWVLNMGGPHGTPAIANERNIVKVVRARRHQDGK